MADSIQLIPVFIGSPSGLEKERRTARSIVEELNRDHSRHWGCLLELVGWEETLPGHGRPQELINKDLDRCEYFIGVLYDHWGSSTAAGDSQYSSGFEEEFERAKTHIGTGAMKDMTVYFKELPAERKRDPGPSLTKVLEFRTACFERKDALYADFTDLASFESLVRAKLNAIGWAEYESRSTRLSPSKQTERPKEQDELSQSRKDESTTLLSAITGAFLTEIVQRSSEWDETSTIDVARLRLIGSSLHRPGNDDAVLGNHDANVLFHQRNSIDFSSDETRALVNCGVEGFGHQNVPLWHWLAKRTKADPQLKRLRLDAVFGKGKRQANAIRLLTLLNLEPPEFGDHINRQTSVQAWMDEESTPDVFSAAILYLRQHGKSEDVSTLEVFYKEAKSQQKADIGQTIITIEILVGQSHALNRTLELGIDVVDDVLGDQLFSKPSSLTTELLSRCLRSEASTIRRHAISILNKRKETAPLLADSLLSDPDYGVRYFAAEALHSAGRALDEDVVKKVLTVVKKGNSLSLFSRTETNTQYFDRYRQNRLSEWEFQDLVDRVDRGGVFDEGESLTLFQRHARRVKGKLRHYLQDGFESYFELRVKKLRSELGGEHKTVLDTERLLPFLRRRMLTAGTEALAKLKHKEDLALLRLVIDDFEVDLSDALLAFLGRFGEWEDIERINGMEYTSRRTNALLISTPPALPQKASSMLSIAQERVADLLAAKFSVLQLREILRQLRRKDLENLSDEFVLETLKHSDDEIRVIMALKCCEHLSKKRLNTLLVQYTEHDEHRYYNSIHWLDMGVSMSLEIGRDIAKKEIASRA